MGDALFGGHFLDVLDDLGVGKAAYAPTSRLLEMEASTRRMIFPERVLGMSFTIQTLRGLAILPISRMMASEIFFSNSGLGDRSA